MSSRDLTTKDAVKTYRGITDSNSDNLIARLVTAMSTAFVQETAAEILRQSYTEIRDGCGETALELANVPAITDPTVTVDDNLIPKRATVTDTGWVLLDRSRLELVGYEFSWGTGNVVLVYDAGQLTPSDAQTIPAVSPYTITAGQPLGRFFSDIGVTFTVAGTALTKVASGPAASQYAVDSTGVYTFNSADQGKAVTLSYAHIPSDVEDCVIEMVDYKMSKRGRNDQTSANIGGQSVSFSREAWPITVQQVIDRWRRPPV